MKSTLLFLPPVMLLCLPAEAQRKPGSPLEHLPRTMEMITHFGERADSSPDNQRIAFMAKSFGDAFVIDLKTRIIRCLTCSVPGAAFLRIMHLADGNYILIGPERFSDIRTSRRRDNELWYLGKEPGSRPVEAQDFYDNDTKMTFTCYRPKGLAGVMSIDMATGQVSDLGQADSIYNEVEGIFPDGKYIAFQVARAEDEAGVGYGIILLRLAR
ncbi:MAG: hypothetical protein FJW20_16920 [Acidimicrobiia bacterium]|nr:hypothetical protein [Acidimicrobiia bacterium]